MFTKHETGFLLDGFTSGIKIDTLSLEEYSQADVHEHIISLEKIVISLNERLKNHENGLQSVYTTQKGSIMTDVEELKSTVTSLEQRIGAIETSIESKFLKLEIQIEKSLKNELVRVEHAVVKVTVPIELKIKLIIAKIKSKIQQVLLKIVDKLK